MTNSSMSNVQFVITTAGGVTEAGGGGDVETWSDLAFQLRAAQLYGHLQKGWLLLNMQGHLGGWADNQSC